MNIIRPSDRAEGDRCQMDCFCCPTLIAGPQGPEGPRGPMGPQGPIGPQGPAGPSVTLAAVTDLAADATLADAAAKLNELLGVLRDSGLMQT